MAAGGVSLAWLLLSVQLSLVPLLHALHGHSLTDRHVALGHLDPTVSALVRARCLPAAGQPLAAIQLQPHPLARAHRLRLRLRAGHAGRAPVALKGSRLRVRWPNPYMAMTCGSCRAFAC